MKKLLFPPVWQMVIMVILSTVALLDIFLNNKSEHPVAYVVYVFSFYTLVVVCVACWKNVQIYYRKVKSVLYSQKYTAKYLTEPEYKTHVNLYMSLSVNLVYIIVNIVSAIYYKSVWFSVFSGYYAIMALMHFLLARYMKKSGVGKSLISELKRARACAFILLLVNISLSAVVLMMVSSGKGFSYNGVIIYVIALYTFYVTIAAIVNIVKYRKYKSPVMSMAKHIKLTSAMFSMLFLETAMFSQFGKETPELTKKVMIIATGTGICVIVVFLSLNMIIRTTKDINRRE